MGVRARTLWQLKNFPSGTRQEARPYEVGDLNERGRACIRF